MRWNRLGRERCVVGQVANLAGIPDRLATCATIPELRHSKPEGVSSAHRTWRAWAVLCLLAGYLLFCHGCHGDEDNELFTAFGEGAVTGRR